MSPSSSDLSLLGYLLFLITHNAMNHFSRMEIRVKLDQEDEEVKNSSVATKKPPNEDEYNMLEFDEVEDS